MHEDLGMSADLFGVFENRAREAGKINPTCVGFFPVGLLRKEDEGANLVNSPLMGKIIERPLLSRHRASPKTSMFSCPPFHTPQANRHQMVGRGGGEGSRRV